MWDSVTICGVTTYRNGPKRTSMGTETDRNGLQWVPKRTGTDFSSYRKTEKRGISKEILLFDAGCALDYEI